jgi:hypothetical protein
MIFCVMIGFSFAGCGDRPITDSQFRIVWSEYLSRSFEKSFEKKMSAEEKRALLNATVSDYKIDYHKFVEYLKTKEPDTYKSLF